MSVKIYKAMIEEFHHDKVERAAQEDWRNDSGGAATMEHAPFMDAMFELVDVSTGGIEPAEYAEFLYTLFGRVAQGATGDAYLWRATPQINYGGYTRGYDKEGAKAGEGERTPRGSTIRIHMPPPPYTNTSIRSPY